MNRHPLPLPRSTNPGPWRAEVWEAAPNAWWWRVWHSEMPDIITVERGPYCTRMVASIYAETWFKEITRRVHSTRRAVEVDVRTRQRQRRRRRLLEFPRWPEA